MTAQANTMWICRVREALREGYGVEDIALRERCDVEDVRREVQILREEGALATMFRRAG
jgi:hypothetical protein